ncbi:hypothetical protein IEO21_04390 [Rhodonia placenta]|uniref:HMG box domain-containing protein n=2 Tax=Rhodonia placenta TaxID=104341 RepID=A0A1X6MP33_9APHY|nr:hypothetical protein POSPLADRAFT_1049722 [Postia placenta MAD-698-R-SB12]KAF9815673.1 hypothetical protein IEO21_04390 [Postia placenta]OSX57986.1 hypothetical protein POSPLADRAFT_1049722 [Postia placenta MAD-698-R-SB12]
MPKETTKSTRRRAADKAEKAPKAKGKKDPKAPKRALSAYMFFSQDWRERIKAENPDAGFGEIGKLLGAKWKELDESEKKPYIEQAARDKTRAEQEKTEYDGKKVDSGSGDDDDE